MFGKTHSPETLAKMSEAKSGALNPQYGKVPVSAFQSGANNPMYGKVPNHAMTVNVYSINGTLINSFSSQVAAAEWLNTSQTQVSRYIF